MKLAKCIYFSQLLFCSMKQKSESDWKESKKLKYSVLSLQ